MICTSISELAQLGPVLKSGAELIELRLDLIQRHPSELFSQIPAGIKSIVCCREGLYSEKERMGLLRDAIELGASYVDIELESGEGFAREIISSAENNACDLIISHHDFQGTPGEDELNSKMDLCFDRGGAVAKIATMVQSSEDAVRLLTLHNRPGRKVILGMGPLGRITRVAAPLLGSEFTFASPATGGETAPGQMSAEELNRIYNILKG